MASLRTLVLAEDPLLRQRLVEQVSGFSGLLVVGEGAPGDDELTLVPADVAVWDLGGDFDRARSQLTMQLDPGLPLVLLGPPGLAGEALAWGARGYLRREPESPRLRAALQAAAEGLQVTEPSAGRDAHEEGAVEDLTPREMEVLQLLAEGLPNKEIARRLRISEHTVKFHVNTLLAKFDAHTRTEAVIRAARAGLIIL